MWRSALTLVLIAFSASIGAEELNYTYLQGNFGQVDVDEPGINVDGDGYGIAGSFGLTENFHLFGEYQTAGLDFDVDLNLLEAGLGYNTAISDNLDVITRLEYLNVEVDARGIPSSDENGYGIGVGLRARVSSMIELHGGIDYIDLSDSDGETRANAGFLLNLTETFSVGVKGTRWEDVHVFQLSARLHF